MYTLISLLVSAKWLILFKKGIYSAKGVTIITNKVEELKKKNYGRYWTWYHFNQCKGAYTQKEIECSIVLLVNPTYKS